MSQNQRRNYAGKSILTVQVTTVKFGRLEVKTEDGREGIILEKEWSWDRSVKSVPRSFEKGAFLDTVWLTEKDRGEILYLSLCELEDPWAEAEERYELGQAVTGEVVNLRRFGVFVQLEPGLTAVIWNRDIPLFVEEIPADQLAIGDKLRGVITQLKVGKRKMELSVNVYLKELEEEELKVRAVKMRDLFMGAKAEVKRMEKEVVSSKTPTYQVLKHKLKKIERILILDDDAGHRANVEYCLKNNFKAIIDHANTPNEARRWLEKYSYDIIIIDIHLNTPEDGIQFGKKLLQEQLEARLIYCSANLDGVKRIYELETDLGVSIPFVFKQNGHECDDILEKIDDYMQGRVILNPIARTLGQNQAIKMEELTGNLERGLVSILKPLIEQEYLSHAFVLEVLPELRKTRLLAHYPLEEDIDSRIDFDALYYSPVKTVIETGDTTYHKNIFQGKSADDKALKNLFPRYMYRSCVGVPIFLTGRPLRYVLYVLDRKRDFLDSKTRERAISSVYSLGTMIERAELQKNMTQLNEISNKGHLLSSLIHELNHKVPGISKRLNIGLEQLEQNQVTNALVHLRPLKDLLQNLTELFYAYSKLAQQQVEEAINLNEIIIKVTKQQELFAKDNAVRIYFDMVESLPSVSAQAIHLEQIMVNLILNAIQQIAIQKQRREQLSNQPKPVLGKLFNGYIYIRTQYNKNTCQVQILDSGPGVAYDQARSIFEWGTTSREDGQGMGLYISQNLAEAMNGKIHLADTIRYIGSLFVIEFPNNYEPPENE